MLSKRLKFLADNGPVPGVHSNLRAVNEEKRENCEFIKSITKGKGGSGDGSHYVEKAMDSALAQAAKEGADSYFVVNVDITGSSASVVLEALRCK